MLESSQMFNPDYLCLAEPALCARILEQQASCQNDCCLISAGNSEELEPLSCPQNMTFLVTNLSLIGISNLINQYGSQVAHLSDLLAAASPYNIRSLLSTAFQLTGGSFVILDRHLSVKENKISDEDNSLFEEFVQSRQKSKEVLDRLFHQTALPKQEALFTENNRQSIFIPISQENGLLSTGLTDNDLLAPVSLLIAEKIFPLLNNSFRSAPSRRLSFQLIFSRIITEKDDSDGLLMTMLKELPSPPKPFMRLILIRSHLHPEEQADEELDVLFSSVKSFFPREHIAITSTEIVVLLSSDKIYCPITFNDSEFEVFLKTNQAIAMIGNPVTSIRAIRVMYKQCQRMFPVVLALRTNNESRSMTFSRYTIYNVIDICAKNISRELGCDDIMFLCHPGVLSIIRYDRAYGTNLQEIMFHYLMNNCSIAKTSAEMFLHRNTTIYKLKKIEELLGESMEDPNLRCDLIFSCLLLQYREKYQKEGVSLYPLPQSRHTREKPDNSKK
ncbi:MAG: helix-turn-helix domain-containing protein [Clostridiales bacterium]|nr:helix-turn-helix domain-containing protein [Clostridiales bacterium]